jgi:hypothetical protein
MASRILNLTDAAKTLLSKLPRRVPCYRHDYRVALALRDMGLVTLEQRQQRGNIVSYLVAEAFCGVCGGSCVDHYTSDEA